MRLSRLPLRARLVAGFVGAMVIVLIAAGAFVFWRVQVALDDRLNQQLSAQTGDLRAAAARQPPGAAITALRGEAREAQLLSADGSVLASGLALADRRPLLTPDQVRRARYGRLRAERGNLLSERGQHLRVLALPVRGPTGRRAQVAVTAVRLDQRDEALRELLLQLTIANLIALAVASAVGYALARAALDPVEHYRAQAEQITHGATGLRLDVPTGPEDEVTRLGATLNVMLDAQQQAAERQQQFIDDASHELRTPLSTLSAEIEMALRKPRTATEHERALGRMAHDTARLIDLAETLLTVGVLAGVTAPATPFSAGELVQTAAQRARSCLPDGRAVRVLAPADLVLHGDQPLLERALGNLVDNASRYGEGDVTVSAESMDTAGGPAARLTVHDQGPGIPAAFLPHAAERFRQHESSRTGPGVGLGLSLADAILTAHGGQLRVCAAGHHHHQPTVDAALRQIPCRHPDDGTTISLLLAPAPAR